MFPNAVYFGIFLISQVCIGVLANSSLFVALAYTFLVQPNLKRPIDFIIMHLTVVNNLSIIVTLIPHIKASFGVRHFLDDTGCKAFLYIYRATRGVSMCTTSLVSTFQAITISPMNSKWAVFKSKLSSTIAPSLILFWLINLLIYIHVIETIRAVGKDSLVGHGYSHVYCQTPRMPTNNTWEFISIILAHDLVFFIVMLWTSLYMVSLLYRHHRRARTIRSTFSQASAEIKATQNILLLVTCFVLFYFSDNFVTLLAFYSFKKNMLLNGISVMLSACYPTICPFILMKKAKMLYRFFRFTLM